MHTIDLHPGIDATRLSALMTFDRSTIELSKPGRLVQGRILAPQATADRDRDVMLLRQLADLHTRSRRPRYERRRALGSN